MNKNLPIIPKGVYTHNEIYSQPDAWQAALTVLAENLSAIRSINPLQVNQVIFTGCGSTYYLAMAAASLTQQLTHCPARGLPASELWLYPDTAYPTGQTLLIAISRSGETTETLRACESFLADHRGTLLTLSCYPEMPLAGMGAFNLVLPSGQEHSVAQTRAFSTLYLATTALAVIWAERGDLFASLNELPNSCLRMLEKYSSLAADLAQDLSLERFYFLGSGPRYGLACELSLKMKEMSLSHSEPFHFLEFRHGPKSMVTPSTLLLGLRSTINASYEEAVLADVRKLGGHTLVMGETEAEVSFESRLDEAICNVLYLPFGQMFAFERAMAKGLNPDHPANIESVVKI
ncbi:MAG: SIS domain-containing protein [Chloroflexi bacterium RBG_13_50_21]|nr:MAG: SIS domain-containing protein [Chloroflexi bacterium RBG_13_50_21]